MAFIMADRVRETSVTTGLGNLALAGAQPGAQRFGARMAVGDTTWYAITGPGGSWETGVGTYVAANTLERTTPLESSNGDARVNFAAGMKDVFMTVPAKRTVDPMRVAPPPLPGNDANVSLPAGSYSVQQTWTGSPFSGTDPKNIGTLFVLPWSATYQTQVFYPANVGPVRVRQIVDSTVNAWREVIEREEITALVSSINTALAGKAPTSHTHPVSQISDSGATGRGLVQATSAASARQFLGVFTPSVFTSSRGSQTVGNTKIPLAFVDFVATAPTMMACSFSAMTAGGQIYTYLSHEFTNLTGGGVFYAGSEFPTLMLGSNDFKTQCVIDVFSGLGVGHSYRAQLFGRTNDGFATSTSSFIRVLNA